MALAGVLFIADASTLIPKVKHLSFPTTGVSVHDKLLISEVAYKKLVRYVATK